MSQLTSRQIGLYASLTIVGLIVSALFWQAWQDLLAEPYRLVLSLGQNLSPIAVLGLTAVLMLGGLSLMVLLIQPTTVRTGVLALIALIPLFLLHSKLVAVATSAVLFPLLIYYAWQVDRQVENHIQFKSFQIFGPRLPIVITTLSILMSVQFFLTARANLNQFQFSIPEPVVNRTLDLVRPLLQEQLKSQQGAANQQLSQLPFISQFPPDQQQQLLQGNIPEELRAQLRSQGIPETQIQEFEQELQSAAGGEAVGQGVEANMIDLFFTQLKGEVLSQATELITSYKQYLPAILSVSLFLVLRSLGGILNLFAILGTSAVIKLLILSGLVRKESKIVEAERLTANG